MLLLALLGCTVPGMPRAEEPVRQARTLDGKVVAVRPGDARYSGPPMTVIEVEIENAGALECQLDGYTISFPADVGGGPEVVPVRLTRPVTLKAGEVYAGSVQTVTGGVDQKRAKVVGTCR
jgi:hypothetical protein